MSITVKATRILGTACTVFSAWEPLDGHSTLSYTMLPFKAGQVGRRALPAEIDALPVGPARWAALDAWCAAQYEEAYAAILAAHPEAARGTRRDGEIEVWS